MSDRDADRQLIAAVLARDEQGGDSDLQLTAREREAFPDMLEQCDRSDLTDKQRSWVQEAAARLKVVTAAPARNVFSAMPLAQQRLHLERAKKVALPWEREGYAKALKPPGRK